MITPSRIPDPAHRVPLRAWAAATVLGAFSAAAGAQGYTSVTTDQGFRESFVAAPLSMPSMGGSASVQANGLSLHASDSTHWVGGPFVAALSSHKFGVAGAAGTYETLSFTISVESHFGNDLAADFTASHGFNIELYGNAAPYAGAGAGLSEVNCIGCGGHLIYSAVGGTQGPSGAWGNDFAHTYTFSTQVERGWNEAGRLGMSAYLGLGSTWANLSIDLLSITDGQGRTLTWGADGFLQPVPEPATSALWLAGAGVLAFAARRRRA